MARHFGEIGPPEYGTRWSWPVVSMEPGDTFEVDQANRSHGDVANTVRVLAARFGKRISVVQHPEKQGFTLVECRSWDDVNEAPKRTLEFDWLQFERFLIEHGAVVNDHGISYPSYSWETGWSKKPRVDRLRLKLFDGFYEVELGESEIRMRRMNDVPELVAPPAIEDDVIASLMHPRPVEEHPLLED